MKKIEEYFQRYSSDNNLFQPEFLCARAIRQKVEGAGRLTTGDAEDILKIYNETNVGQHDNGSGWLDYQLHLQHLLSIDNIKFDVDNSSMQIRLIISFKLTQQK